MALREMIKQQCEAWRSLGHTDLLGEFMLRNADRERQGQRLPKPFKKQRDKLCFCNAGGLLLKNKDSPYTYYEGYAARASIMFPIHHAWLVVDDRVIDTTWRDPDETCLYFGKPFSYIEVATRVSCTKYWGLLDTGMGYDADYMITLDPGFSKVIGKKRSA